MVDNSQSQSAVNNDEVDFVEVFRKIWAGRKLIGIIVVVSAVLGFIVLKLTPSYYKIEATIDVLPTDQLRALFPSELGAAEYQVSLPDAKKIYDKVLLQIASLASLRTYWEIKTHKTLPNGKDDIKSAEDNENLIAFKKFVENFSLEPRNPKSIDISARKLTLMHTDRVQGISIMNDYLAFSAREVLSDQIQQLDLSFQASLKSIDTNYTNKTQVEERKLNDALINLRESLKLAESLGIKKTPFRDLENVQLKVLDGQGYLLGTKTIMQQIEILTARQGKSLAPFSLDLRNMESWRAQMESDRERIKQLDGKLQLFSIVNPPEASFDPVKPNKTLILISIIFTAGVIGISIVLVQSFIAERKKVKNI